MRRSILLFLFFSAITYVLAGCGHSGNSAAQATGSSTPEITAISPAALPAGSGTTTLTVTGSNFVTGMQVSVNGSARSTSFVSSTSLQTSLSASDLATSGTLQITVLGANGTSNAMPLAVAAAAVPNPAPTLTALTPVSAPVGQATTLTVSGTNFISSSAVLWNGSALTTTAVSSSSITAQVPATLMQNAGTASITVSNPSPGGGVSNALSFVIVATGTAQQTVINLHANDLVWDPVNQVIYLSLPSADGANGNSVQVLNPVTGTLGTLAFAGSEPDLLSVSSTSKYLYVALDGGTAVQRMLLPALTPDVKLGLGSDSFDGPYYAMDLQASPVSDGSVAIVRGVDGFSPAEEGGVIIYDDSVIRANPLCGWIQAGCTNTSGLFAGLYDSIQWNKDGSVMYAANNEDTGFDFYVIPVSASGFGKVTDYGGLASGFGYSIHFDATTGLVYDDDGTVIDPSAGTKVAQFGSSGLMVPDGSINTAFFLSSSLSGGTVVLQSYDMTHYTPLNTLTIKNVTGTPTHLIRWGTNGLAFTTTSTTYGTTTTTTGSVYILSGSFVH